MSQNIDYEFLAQCQELYGEPAKFTFDLNRVSPNAKDISRAENLSSNGRRTYSNGSPFEGKARTMAKAICDPRKMVRRAKAVVKRWGHEDHTGTKIDKKGNEIIETNNPWRAFETALSAMGFTWTQIQEIRDYQND